MMQENYSSRTDVEEQERNMEEIDSLYVFRKCGGISVQRAANERGRRYYLSKRDIETIGNPVPWKEFI